MAAAARRALEAKCALLNQVQTPDADPSSRSHCPSSANARLARRALQDKCAQLKLAHQSLSSRQQECGTSAELDPASSGFLPRNEIDDFRPTHFSQNGARPAGDSPVSHQSRKAEELIRRIGKLRQSIQAHGITTEPGTKEPDLTLSGACEPSSDSAESRPATDQAVDPQDIVRHFKFMRNLLKGYELPASDQQDVQSVPTTQPAARLTQPTTQCLETEPVQELVATPLPSNPTKMLISPPKLLQHLNSEWSNEVTELQTDDVRGEELVSRNPAPVQLPGGIVEACCVLSLPEPSPASPAPTPQPILDSGNELVHARLPSSRGDRSPAPAVQVARVRSQSARAGRRSTAPKITAVADLTASRKIGSQNSPHTQKSEVVTAATVTAATFKTAAHVDSRPRNRSTPPASNSTPQKQVKRKSTASAVRKLELDRLKRRLAMSDTKHASLEYYQSVKVIGAGSYGKVWVARHKLTNREVAIKILDKSKLSDSDAKKRVAQEIRIMGKLKHPHIIRLFEVIEEQGDINMIMEFAPQGSLYDSLKASKRFTELRVRQVCAELLTAVEYIHSKNFYHRDIKLANILLGADGTTKLADFGLGVFKSEGKKLVKFCGSPAYLAPEIILGQGYDGAAVDMWCVGIVLYALFAGDVPFRADSFAALRRKILKGSLDYNFSITSGAKDVLSNLLNADPTIRHSAAVAMQQSWVLEDATCAELVGKVHQEHKTVETLDQGCVSKVVECGVSEDFVVNTVIKNDHNHVLTCYYLLLEQKEGKEEK